MSTNNITLEWDAPDGITKATYIVNFTNFWGDKVTVEVVDNTKYEFTNLKSGTRYFYKVYNKAGSFLSLPAIYNVSTGENFMTEVLSSEFYYFLKLRKMLFFYLEVQLFKHFFQLRSIKRSIPYFPHYKAQLKALIFFSKKQQCLL